MNKHNTKSFRIIIITTLILIQIPSHFCQTSEYSICRRPFTCGELTNLTYPFYGGDRPPYCGHPNFNLICSSNTTTPPLINISSISYQILEINERTQTLRIARQDLLNNDLCPTFQVNTTLDFNIFDYYQNPNYRNVTLYYGCALVPTQLLPNQFNCSSERSSTTGFYVVGDIEAVPGVGLRCGESVYVPVNETAAFALAVPGPWSLGVLREALVSGFWVRWFGGVVVEECGRCVGSGGVCGRRDLDEFACFCVDGVYGETCGDSGGAGNGNGT